MNTGLSLRKSREFQLPNQLEGVVVVVIVVVVVAVVVIVFVVVVTWKA